MGPYRDVGQLERSPFVRDDKPGVIEHHHRRRHMRMDLAEHFDDARFVEPLTAALPLGKAAEVERLGARQREHVVIDGIVVREFDGRADSDRDNTWDEVFVALPNFGVHHGGWRSWRVLQIDDNMTQLRFRRQGHCWYIPGVS